MSKKKKAVRKRAKVKGIGEVAPPARQPEALQKSHREVRVLSWLLPIVILTIVVAALRGPSMREFGRPVIGSTESPMPRPKFVGSAVCATCHERENALWRGSHHQLAMQPAAASTVLGDFNNASFSNSGIMSTFFRRGSRFMVRTDGPDGALHDYEVKYTFGVYPLQQYLIPMPGGRLQALGIAWDCRPRGRGGQRWFFLYPGQRISPSNRLHWTSIDQTWNYMCADCHSTNLRKNYELRTRTYSTTYADIDVACEACHGPDSNHVAWAKRQNDWKKFDGNHGLTIALDERKGVSWPVDVAGDKIRRSRPRESEREIEMCARCHSRRAQIHEDYVHGQPVGDDYRVALLDEDLYFPDGQVKGEVYEYGSFIQSRMFQAGVTCSDCHEPHSLRLRADGNNVCLQCHSGQRYDSPKHHFHEIGSQGARCVECHMPTRTYMVIDARRDHSLRIPRPDLSVKLGTPNACTNCHTDKSAQWASATVDKWWRGRVAQGLQHFAETLHTGSIGAPAAERSLGKLATDRDQPAIARATALSMLTTYDPLSIDAAVRAGVTDDSALARQGAARALSNSDPRASEVTLAPLFHDSVRAVRLEAAEVLAGAPPDVLSSGVLLAMNNSVDEYIASQVLNADRPEAHLNLGLLYAKKHDFAKAETELKIALSLDPAFAPAAVDLADLYRGQNRDTEGEHILRDAISRSTEDASLQHALGLLMVREKRGPQALALFAAAARIEPGNARYTYVYAVALKDAGQANAAIETLTRSIDAHPYDRDTLAALVAFLEQADPAKALTYARRLDELEPGNPEVRRMLIELTEHQHG